MAKTQYLTYHIHLTDADVVKRLQAQYPQGVNRAPYDPVADNGQEGGAAVEFAIESGIYPPALPVLASGDTWQDPPFITSPWFSFNYQRDVAVFTRDGTKFYWMGQFVLAAPPQPIFEDTQTDSGGAPIIDLQPIAQRHFAEGFEIPGIAAGVSHNLAYTPDASRHVGGLGVRLTGRSSASVLVPANAFDAAATPTGRWDRLYVRWRNPGSQPYGFWRVHQIPSSSAGAALTILPSGQLGVENITLSGRTLLATVGDFSDRDWHLVDVIYEFNAAAAGGQGRIRVWLEHELLADFAVSSSTGGLGTNSTRIGSTEVGNVFSITGDDTEIDVDDWIQSEIPTNLSDAVSAWASGTNYVAGNMARDGASVYRATTNHTASSANRPGGASAPWVVQGWNDFLSGSKVLLLKPQSLTGSTAGWAGNFRMLQAATIGTYTTKQALTSSASGALLEGALNLVDLNDPNALGPVAMQVSLFSTRGAASGTLGFSVDGVATDAAIVQNGTFTTYSSNSVMYRPTGLVTPPTWASMSLRHTKGAGADAAGVAMLVAQVELIGVFGPEDQRSGEDEGGGAVAEWPIDPGPHNKPYPLSPWAVGGLSAPFSPVVVYAGTYLGNGTGQELTFRTPVHLFFTRPVQTLAEGTRWLSTMNSARRGGTQFGKPFVACDVREDLSFVPGPDEDAQQQQYVVRIAGADGDSNAAGVTYQYVAFSDPGARFMTNTAIAHQSTLPSAVNLLRNPAFVPEFCLFHGEDIAGNTNTGQYGCKSLGHAVGSVTRDGATVANALTFGTGQFTTQAAFHAFIGGTAGSQTALSLWRAHDGNNDPNEAAVFSAGSYVGDGAASRSLSVGTAGKRPLYVLVFPETGSAMYRDPSHAGTVSNQVLGSNNASTGITAGAVNGFTVGLTLNSNGITYHYFVLWAADATPGNGGWGTNPAGGYIEPVESDSPIDGPWPPDPDEPVPPPEPTPVTPDPGDLSTDIEASCVASSTRLVNQALEAIGVTERVTNLGTDTSQAADTARLHYKTALDAVLAAHPWDFATRYATLTLVSGTTSTPANRDWQFAYRAPADCVKARRLTVPGRGREWNPDPIPFRMGEDATGELLFTGEPNTSEPLILEYTARVACPAANKDALFRLAAKWVLAEAFAPALAKDDKKAQYCHAMFEWSIGKAAEKDMREQQQPKDDGEADWISGR